MTEKDDIFKIVNLDRQDATGRTLLHWASEAGDVKLVQYLLDRKVKAGLTNFAGDTPFATAAASGQVEVVKLFDKMGYKWQEDSNYTSKTPLFLASRGGHLSVVEFLVSKGADVNKVTVKGNTPLLKAIKNNHIAIAACLICAGANVNAENKDGQTPLSLLIEKIIDPSFKKKMPLFRCLNLMIEQGADRFVLKEELPSLKISFQRAFKEECKSSHPLLVARHSKKEFPMQQVKQLLRED